jgi:hypothetical protein
VWACISDSGGESQGCWFPPFHAFSLRAWLIGDNMADKNRTQEKSKKAMTKKARLRKKKAK